MCVRTSNGADIQVFFANAGIAGANVLEDIDVEDFDTCVSPVPVDLLTPTE